MDIPDLYCVLMAGGSGTRFWPASRRGQPKQFLRIAGDEPLLAQTWQRLEDFVPPERVLVVTTADQVEQVNEVLPDLPPLNLLVEPEARNTGPCVALAAHEIHRRAPDSIQVVLPADHVIRPRESFQRTLRAAAREANQSGALIVCGIQPSFPATGFGYIQAGEIARQVDGQTVYRVQRFVEKPDAARAQAFLAEGGYYWNAGIFVWHTRAILRAIERWMPETHAALIGAKRGVDIGEIYRSLPKVSIDVGVLERASGVRMIPIDYFWSDVGSWSSLAEVSEAGEGGNSISGGAELVAEDAQGCIVHAAPGEVVALLGVSDLIVVHSGRATLVLPRDRAQDVRRIVERLRIEAPDFL
jgi:mannose-1-phosphate guanylyltransferase